MTSHTSVHRQYVFDLYSKGSAAFFPLNRAIALEGSDEQARHPLTNPAHSLAYPYAYSFAIAQTFFLSSYAHCRVHLQSEEARFDAIERQLEEILSRLERDEQRREMAMRLRQRAQFATDHSTAS